MHPLNRTDDTLLSRLSSLPASGLTSLQNQIDRLSSDFLDEAAQGKTLAAMVAGGFANRWAKIGALSVASPIAQGEFLPLTVKGASSFVGFAAESLLLQCESWNSKFEGRQGAEFYRLGPFGPHLDTPLRPSGPSANKTRLVNIC
jgi:hypothetical protein